MQKVQFEEDIKKLSFPKVKVAPESEDPLPRPSMCFTCGNFLPQTDFDKYHQLLAPNSASKSAQILDSQLSKPYISVCCRIMFMGDPIEYRELSKYYNFADKSKEVKF